MLASFLKIEKQKTKLLFESIVSNSTIRIFCNIGSFFWHETNKLFSGDKTKYSDELV